MSENVKFRDPRTTHEVELPTYPGSKVVVYSSLLLGHQVKVNDVEGEANQGIASLMYLIKEWNLVDENDKPIPINKESVERLPMTDAMFLLQEVGKFAESQKKSSAT